MEAWGRKDVLRRLQNIRFWPEGFRVNPHLMSEANLAGVGAIKRLGGHSLAPAKNVPLSIYVTYFYKQRQHLYFQVLPLFVRQMTSSHISAYLSIILSATMVRKVGKARDRTPILSLLQSGYG